MTTATTTRKTTTDKKKEEEQEQNELRQQRRQTTTTTTAKTNTNESEALLLSSKTVTSKKSTTEARIGNDEEQERGRKKQCSSGRDAAGVQDVHHGNLCSVMITGSTDTTTNMHSGAPMMMIGSNLDEMIKLNETPLPSKKEEEDQDEHDNKNKNNNNTIMNSLSSIESYTTNIASNDKNNNIMPRVYYSSSESTMHNPPPPPAVLQYESRETSTGSSTMELALAVANNNNSNNAKGAGGGLDAATTTTAVKRNNKAMSGDQVGKDEKRSKKVITRVIVGACMFAVFGGSVYMGHVYICILVALIEGMLFRELVRVRYNAFFTTIEDTIPLFRTLQWLWFIVAIFYVYGDFISDVITSNSNLHYLIQYVQYIPTTISFGLYSGTFVITISTLQREHIKFQLNQLSWTIIVICLTVGQLKYIMHNVFNGLFWFTFPCCLVFTNDIMAYVSGMLWGKKFIHREFISFSPNKTWEGFIGSWFFTMITAWYLARFLAQYDWMICPTNEFRLWRNTPLTCKPDPIFQEAQGIFPSQIFEMLPRGIVKMLVPRVVEICSVVQDGSDAIGSSSSSSMNNDDGGDVLGMAGSSLTAAAAAAGTADLILTPCVSGDESQVHHHFEYVTKRYYPIQWHALWLGLFASLVAPFGGFLASAIKRAYGIKDFDSFLPGHGGIMDRMDCQLLMALYTWVHYNTFVKLAFISVPKLAYMYSLLSEHEKHEFLKVIQQTQQ